MARSFAPDPSEHTFPINDTEETVESMVAEPHVRLPADPELAATAPALAASQRGRVMMAFGLVFLLVAATLVVVAQNAVRRMRDPIMIQTQR